MTSGLLIGPAICAEQHRQHKIQESDDFSEHFAILGEMQILKAGH